MFVCVYIWLQKDGSRLSKENFSYGFRSLYSVSIFSYLLFSVLFMRSSFGFRSKEIVIIDFYLDALIKETKVRIRNRLIVSINY